MILLCVILGIYNNGAIFMEHNYQNTIENNKKSLKELIGNISYREAVNLHLELLMIYPNTGMHINKNLIKDNLINTYAPKENIINTVENNLLIVRQNLIDESEFDWLRNSKRIQITCLEILKRIPVYQTRQDLYGNDKFEQFQSSIDTLNFVSFHSSFQPQTFQSPTVQYQQVINQMPLHEKLNVLKNIKSLYNQIHELDNYSRWLEANNQTQIEWTKQYLKTSNFYISKVIGKEEISTIKDTVLSSLDLIGYTPDNNKPMTYSLPLEKKLFVDKMKRAWSQKKYRDAGKTKSQYHLPLTKMTKARLEKLAEVKGLSTTAMLDAIINTAYERDCLGENGEELY